MLFPAFNEEANISETVFNALSYLQGKQGEVVVVDDGSRDRTADLVDSLSKQHPGRVRLVRHAMNLGYAHALRDGFAAAKGDWIFYSDADNQFDLSEIDLLWPHSEGSDLVVGFRKNRQDPFPRILAARVYNWIARTLFGIGVRDIDCAFKLFRKDVFDRIRIESSGFLVDCEILAKAHKSGMKVREVGVTHRPRTRGRSTVRARDVLRTLRGLAWLFKKIHFSK